MGRFPKSRVTPGLYSMCRSRVGFPGHLGRRLRVGRDFSGLGLGSGYLLNSEGKGLEEVTPGSLGKEGDLVTAKLSVVLRGW